MRYRECSDAVTSVDTVAGFQWSPGAAHVPVQHACTAGRARPPRALTRLPAAPGELQQQALTRLALQTLGSFDFGPARLLEFCRDHVVSYLDESDVATRRAAALAAAQVRARARSRRAAAAGAGSAMGWYWREPVSLALSRGLGLCQPLPALVAKLIRVGTAHGTSHEGRRGAPRNWPGHSH